MMYRYKLIINYLGTNYCGWQRQPNQPTVQEKIENVLNQILQDEIKIYGQGRTDSGVHAKYQVAHFDSPRRIDCFKIRYALLGLLPGDIAVSEIYMVPSDFHARFSAQKRTYKYKIITQPDAFLAETSLLLLHPPELDLLQQCALLIVGTHDFKNFAIEPPDKNSTCTIEASEWQIDSYQICYRITGNRFLRHMVRRLVGTMLKVAQKKKRIDDFKSLLFDVSSAQKPHMAAAKGLTLEKVIY